MPRSSSIIALLGGSLAASVLSGEDVAPPGATAPLEQPVAHDTSAGATPIIVTADRQREPWDETTTSTSVITPGRMREQGFATNAADYLRLIPGVDLIDANGGIDGGTEQVRLRGSAAQSDTEFLLDGIPLYDVTTTNGTPSLALFTQPELASIEVVKGSQSGLYGSHAVGGVVNLLSARPTAQAHADGEIEYGSFDTLRVAGAASGPLEGSHLTSDGQPLLGFSLGVDGIDSRSFATQTRNANGDPKGSSDDRVRKIGANARLEARPDDHALIHLSGLYSNVYQAYSGFSAPDEPDFHRVQLWRMGAGAEYVLPSLITVGADYAHTRSIRDEASISNLDSQFSGDDDFLGVKIAALVGERLSLTLGADGDHQSAVTQSLDHESQNTEGAYLKAGLISGPSGPWVLDAVIRHDRTSRHADATTYRLGGDCFPLHEDHRIRLHAALGTAFRAPSLDEQFGVYTFPSGTFVGNPDLLPQTSRSWEAGIDIRPSPVVLLASTFFSTEYHRRIVAVFDPTFTNGTLVNETSDSGVHGIENELSWDNPSRSVGVHATYTWQRTHDDNGNRFVLLPSRKATADVIVRHEGGWVLLGVDAIGQRSASDGTTLSGYATLHASLGYQITACLTAYVRAENLLGTGYVSDHYTGSDPVTFNPEEFYYTGMPRSAFVGLEGHF